MINAVMLGAIAAADALPIRRRLSRRRYGPTARRRGQPAGFSRRLAGGDRRRRARAPRRQAPARCRALVASLEAEATATMPAAACEIVTEGLRRTAAFQDAAYAGLYFDRLKIVRDSDARADTGGGSCARPPPPGVRMTFEDVIRVAEAKIAPARFARIRQEIGVADSEPFRIVDFLKPASRKCARSCRPGWHGASWRSPNAADGAALGHGDREHVAHRLSALLAAGPAQALAAARHRYAQEQAAIEQWLGLIAQAARASADVAIEVAECARLVKGYGDTWQRGVANYQTIEAQVIADPRRRYPLARAPTRSRARAPPRWSIRRARASPGVWPISRAAPRPCASRPSDPPPRQRQRSGVMWCWTSPATSRSSPSWRSARPFTTPTRSFVSRFWLIFHLPRPAMAKRKPTMPRSMTSI